MYNKYNNKVVSSSSNNSNSSGGYGHSRFLKQSTKQLTNEPIFEGSEIDGDNSIVNSQRNTIKSESINNSPDDNYYSRTSNIN